MLPKDVLLNHVLVPKHEILSEEEVEELLKKLGVTKDQLPKIKADDPVVKALGAKVGQVLRIRRRSLTAGETLYYRVVVR